MRADRADGDHDDDDAVIDMICEHRSAYLKPSFRVNTRSTESQYKIDRVSALSGCYRAYRKLLQSLYGRGSLP